MLCTKVHRKIDIIKCPFTPTKINESTVFYFLNQLKEVVPDCLCHGCNAFVYR